MDLEEACRRLEGRVRHEGLTMPAPAAARDIAAVDEAVAPLRLPADYRYVLRRWAPRLPLTAFPELCDLGFGLDGWREDREMGMVPRVLFTVGYSSHTWLGVELESDVSPGGELYSWSPGAPFTHLPGGLATYLAALAEAPASAAAFGGTLPVDLDLRQLESGRTVGYDVTDWPDHWLAAEGIPPDDLVPKGATATVEEVLGRRAGSPVHERVHVRVVRLAVVGTTALATVADRTGSMVVTWLLNVGPAPSRMGADFELEVTRIDATEREGVDAVVTASRFL
jgi:hypothetical protein